MDNDDELKNTEDIDYSVEQIPQKGCSFCCDPFKSREIAYKCNNCNNFFHYPGCLGALMGCRVCGEPIDKVSNLIKLIKFRNVLCPKCGMKIKIFYGPEEKLNIFCPSCGHEGNIPNPYLGEIYSHGKSEMLEEEFEDDLEVDVEAEDKEDENYSFGIELDPLKTLDEFEINDQNRVLHSIASKISQQPGEEFNLIFIYGPIGSGKTHILSGIGNKIKNDYQDLLVINSSFKKFVEDLRYATENEMVSEFDEFYSNSDVLLLDDFHALPNDKIIQERFLNLCDNLIINNKQIILVSNISLDRIKSLSDEIKQQIITKSGLIIKVRKNK